jgi:hypothetical protein
MLKQLPAIFVSTFCLLSFSQAQLLSWTPAFPVQNDASANVVITMDATKGNQGLLNYSPTNDVYVHIGVITNLSTGPTNWRYVLFTWGTTPAQAQCSYLGNHKWSFTINGSLRTYFGITNSTEQIQKIAILFRNGGGTVAQRNADGSDMFIPVYDNSLAVRFEVPPMQPLYVPQPEPINVSAGNTINITAVANRLSNMKLYLNGNIVQSSNNVTTLSASPLLSVAGNQMIVAEADDGSSVKRDTLRFYAAAPVNVAPLPSGVRDGINYGTDNTSVTLVLFAPQKNRVSVIGEFAGSNWTEQVSYQMNKTPDGNRWWLTITGLTPGNEYAFQYLVDGTLKIAEPYAEKILDPWNDASIPPSTYPGLRAYPAGMTTGIVSLLQTAEPAYTWQINNFNRPDKRNLVIYELLLRDFLAAHDWNTLRDTLNYLKNLGVNAIEIMPFNEFDGNLSWGYNPSFFFAPDKYYGPKNTLKRFIDSCHSKGIAVIMDIVLNHATGLCPLAALYWDHVNNQPAANNPWFNVTATHPFNVFNDFNHESPATQYFFSRVVEHWLQQYKIDGFRFDLSKGFTQFNSGNNVSLWSQYDASRVAIWKRYYDTLQLKSPGCYVILEHFADNTEEKELSDYGMLLWGNGSYNFQEAAMGYVANSNFEHLLHVARGWNNPYLVGYMESHDEERMMYKNLNFGNASGGYNTRELNTALRRMELSAVFLFAMPGPKMFWQFGEMGYDFSINRCTDGTVNANCRLDPKPIRWDYLQIVQRKRLHDIYSSLLKLRAHSWYKDVFLANNVSITRSMTSGFKWLTIRSAGDTSILCLLGNLDVTAQSASFTFPAAGTWYDYLNGTTTTASGMAQNITLQPGQYHVYLNRNLVNAVVTSLPGTVNANTDIQVHLFPNPAIRNSILELTLPESGVVEIELLNNTGQKIQTVFRGFRTRGIHRLPVSLNNSLPAGPYLIRTQTKKLTRTIKFILQ